MPTMQTSLGTISYTDDGPGPPILLLHAALHDRTDFAPVHDSLANGRRVLALDWPGHGASPSPAAPLRAVQFGDLATEFVDRLNLNNMVVVGNSVGGYAACRLALDRPERIAGVVLVNTGGFTDHSAFTRAVCALMGRPGVIKAVSPLSVRAYMHPRNPRDEAVVDRVVARAKTTDGARTAAALWASFTDPGHDLRGRAAQITAPVLITWGTKDLTAPRRGAGRGGARRHPRIQVRNAADRTRRVLVGPGGVAGVVLPVRRRRPRRAEKPTRVANCGSRRMRTRARCAGCPPSTSRPSAHCGWPDHRVRCRC